MTDEEKKAWGEIVAAENSEDYPDLVRDVLVPRWLFRTSDAELTRLRAIVARVEDVESIAKVIIAEFGKSMSLFKCADAISAWAKEG